MKNKKVLELVIISEWEEIFMTISSLIKLPVAHRTNIAANGSVNEDNKYTNKIYKKYDSELLRDKNNFTSIHPFLPLML